MTAPRRVQMQKKGTQAPVAISRAARLLGALLLVLGMSASARGDPPLRVLDPLDQVEVNEAIRKGVIYLRTRQQRTGTWSPDNRHTVGYAALPGLTLLECEAPLNDRQVQMAAHFVRTAWDKGQLDGTYELALSILLLDRLNPDPKSAPSADRARIHSMAARLIAGQTASGGWGYKCPQLSTVQTREILTLLQQLTPALTTRDPDHPHRSPDDPPPGTQRDPLKPGDEITQGSYPSPASFPRPGWCIKMSDEVRPESTSAAAQKPAPPIQPPPQVRIPARLAGLPVFHDPNRPPLPDPPGKHSTPGVTDNSNTQFAILGLWAARRYGVPMERSLNLVVRRFRTSQNADGRWGYPYVLGGGGGGRPAMTCVGLLGLAIGHGIAQDPDAKERADADEMIKKGFLALHRMIGTPQGRLTNLPMENLYFLWSVERVAVLYNLATILEKDWYRWGAEILVANQQPDGSWNSTEYPGRNPHIDTCFALLFLKRANLARDLTSQLPYNPAELTSELIARLPTEPAPTKTTPNESPGDESLKGTEKPPAPRSPAEPTPGTTRPEGDSTKTGETGPASSSQSEEPETRSNRMFLVFGLGLVILLLAFGMVALIVMNRSPDEEEARGARRPPRRNSARKVRKPARD